MKSLNTHLAAGLTLFLATEALRAQEFAPHIGYVYPAGGQQGATIQVTFGGQFLVEPSEAHVSGTGVRAAVIPSEPLLSGKQAAEARGQLKELRKKGGAALQEIRKLSHRLAVYERSKITPAIGEKVTVQISIARDAAPGNREVRLVTATGLTNALVFQVGQLPECREPEPEQDNDWMRIQKSINDPDSRVKSGRNDAPPSPVTLPATINGQILPGEVDRFRFQARKGQKVAIAVSARELLPYLADTVPGWLQATIALSDPKGKELTAADDIQIRPDPVLRYEIPEDGDYVLAVKDNLYRGRDDFVYRIRIGEVSLIASILSHSRATAQTTAEKLSAGTQTLNPRDKKPGGYPSSGRDKSGTVSNIQPFQLEPLPETMEKEPNNTPGEAQPVTLPVIIRGHISQPGDMDVFRFDGRAGDQIVAEVNARRLDSPLDSVLILTDAAGNRIGFNDDHEDKGSGLNTHHADSYLAVTLPAQGVYFVQIGDTQQLGGAAYGYRLRISSPQPDFALRIVPSTVNIRANATQPVTVFALRSDGFAGEIALGLKDAPPGFLLIGGNIPANQDMVQYTLTAPASPTKTPIQLMLEGRAMIRGRAFVHSAVPAQQMTQAFSYQHLVPSDDLLVQVIGNAAPDAPASLLSKTPVKIPLHGSAPVQFSVPRYSRLDTNQIRLVNPPEGIALKDNSWDSGRLELVIEADATKLKAGLAGNLIAAFVAKDPTPAGAPRINPKRVPLGCLPAIPYEVVK